MKGGLSVSFVLRPPPVSVAEVGQKGFHCHQVAQDGKTILEITLDDFDMFLPKIYIWSIKWL